MLEPSITQVDYSPAPLTFLPHRSQSLNVAAACVLGFNPWSGWLCFLHFVVGFCYFFYLFSFLLCLLYFPCILFKDLCFFCKFTSTAKDINYILSVSLSSFQHCLLLHLLLLTATAWLCMVVQFPFSLQYHAQTLIPSSACNLGSHVIHPYASSCGFPPT